MVQLELNNEFQSGRNYSHHSHWRHCRGLCTQLQHAGLPPPLSQSLKNSKENLPALILCSINEQNAFLQILHALLPSGIPGYSDIWNFLLAFIVNQWEPKAVEREGYFMVSLLHFLCLQGFGNQGHIIREKQYSLAAIEEWHPVYLDVCITGKLATFVLGKQRHIVLTKIEPQQLRKHRQV